MKKTPCAGPGEDLARTIKAIEEVALKTRMLALNVAINVTRGGAADRRTALAGFSDLARSNAEFARVLAQRLETAIRGSACNADTRDAAANLLADVIMEVQELQNLAATLDRALPVEPAAKPSGEPAQPPDEQGQQLAQKLE